MGRRSNSNSYITPVSSAGAEQVQSAVEFGRGAFTLVALTTYYYPLDGADSVVLSAHAHWDASIIITSMRIEDCNMAESEVSAFAASTGGLWLTENPSTAYIAVAGAGVSATSATVAATGGAVGGAMFHVGNTGAKRHRLAVVVGATGGEMRVATWGKD